MSDTASNAVLPLEESDIPFRNDYTGELKEANLELRKQMLRHYRKTAPSMPKNVQKECRDHLKRGHFYHHNLKYVQTPSEHYLYYRMYKSGVFHNFSMTFVNFWLLGGVFGFDNADMDLIHGALALTYNVPLPKDGTWPGAEPAYQLTWDGKRGAKTRKYFQESDKAMERIQAIQDQDQDGMQPSTSSSQKRGADEEVGERANKRQRTTDPSADDTGPYADGETVLALQKEVARLEKKISDVKKKHAKDLDLVNKRLSALERRSPVAIKQEAEEGLQNMHL